MKEKNRFVIHRKATQMEPHSPDVASAIKRGGSQHRCLRGLAIAAAILIVPVLTLYKISAAAGAAQHRFHNGATAPWEKTGGPPGLQTNVIFEANNTVYA